MTRLLDVASSLVASCAGLLLTFGIVISSGTSVADEFAPTPSIYVDCPRQPCNGSNDHDLSGCLSTPPSECIGEEDCGDCDDGYDGYGDEVCTCS